MLALAVAIMPIPARSSRYARSTFPMSLLTPVQTVFGLFPPLAAPFQVDGRLNKLGLRDLVDFLAANGADGLCGASRAGEFMKWTRAAWERVVGTCANQNRGRVPMLAGLTDMADGLAISVLNNLTAALPLAVFGCWGAATKSGLALRWRSRLPVGEPHLPRTPTPQVPAPLGEVSFRSIEHSTPNPNQP